MPGAAVIETYKLTHLKREDFITELYNRYGKKLFSYARHTWNLDEDDTWNLVYETLFKVIDSYRKYTFESEEKFASFMFRVFINLMRNHYRDTKKEREAMPMTSIEVENLEIPVAASQHETQKNEHLEKLNLVLDTLEDWEKILLLMRSDGRPYAEIAEYVKRPEEQLKVYYQRLKKKITDKLNGPQ